ncbi:MAG: PEP-utilizing enzyme [Acidimicrobiia bacterium]
MSDLDAVLEELAEVTDPGYPLCTPVGDAYPVYTRNNIGEVMPGVASPATVASAVRGLERAYVRTHKRFGLLGADAPEDAWRYLGMFYGRACIGWSAQMEMNRRSPGAPWWPWSSKVVARPGIDPASYEKPASVRVWAADCAARLRAARRLAAATRELPGRVDDLARRLEAEVARVEGADHRDADLDQLKAEVGRPSMGAEVLEAHLAVSFLAGAYYAQLENRVRAWTDLAPGPTATGLLMGLGAIESARSAAALGQMAVAVAVAPRLAGLLRDGDLDGFAAALDAPADEAERAVRAERDAFLATFGHRAVAEAELGSSTWADDPSELYRSVGRLVATGGVADRTPEARRARLEEELLGRLKGARRGRMLRTLELARRYTMLRERTKSLTVRNGAKRRSLMREVGRRFAEAGIVEDPSDLSQLTLEDLLAATPARAGEVRELVRRRRRAAELFARLELPAETFTAPPRPVLADAVGAPAPSGAGAEVLTGMGVSPGTFEGVVQVVGDARAGADLSGEEVLVAPFTDAAWSPLFMLSAAVVVDTGGMISHGAILARELGLPAVVNVPGTTELRSGDRVLVDGDRGTVTVLERVAR